MSTPLLRPNFAPKVQAVLERLYNDAITTDLPALQAAGEQGLDDSDPGFYEKMNGVYLRCSRILARFCISSLGYRMLARSSSSERHLAYPQYSWRRRCRITARAKSSRQNFNRTRPTKLAEISRQPAWTGGSKFGRAMRWRAYGRTCRRAWTCYSSTEQNHTILRYADCSLHAW
jgi:hypothetical protein